MTASTENEITSLTLLHSLSFRRHTHTYTHQAWQGAQQQDKILELHPHRKPAGNTKNKVKQRDSERSIIMQASHFLSTQPLTLALADMMIERKRHRTQQDLLMRQCCGSNTRQWNKSPPVVMNATLIRFLWRFARSLCCVLVATFVRSDVMLISMNGMG